MALQSISSASTSGLDRDRYCFCSAATRACRFHSCVSFFTADVVKMISDLSPWCRVWNIMEPLFVNQIKIFLGTPKKGFLSSEMRVKGSEILTKTLRFICKPLLKQNAMEEGYLSNVIFTYSLVSCVLDRHYSKCIQKLCIWGTGW